LFVPSAALFNSLSGFDHEIDKSTFLKRKRGSLARFIHWF